MQTDSPAFSQVERQGSMMQEVVAALICREMDGKRQFLIAQRPENKARGLLWEFVGGKVEVGESREAALERECREELGVSISVGALYWEGRHSYPDLEVHLSLFRAAVKTGTIQKLEHNDLQWITPDEIGQFEFCPADVEILKQICKQGVEDGLTELQRELFAMQDLRYRNFTGALIPTVSPDRVIGVRTPKLRTLAKNIQNRASTASFLAELPHRYYEENNLHAFLISAGKDYRQTIGELDRFLPFVDNWATCDSMSPKVFRKNHAALRGDVARWIKSDHPFAVRFGIKTLMTEFLDNDFCISDAYTVAQIDSDEYYVKMMQAWYFATALAKHYEKILPFLREGKLSPWVYRMTVRKACESYRITEAQKAELRALVPQKTE